EEHYTLADTELEYLVRFQNTGNATAQTVLIRDTIAPELDLGSFALMANSHNVMTTIDPVTREIQFLFENIMLPDSTANEPESHGLVSYVIKPYADTPAETVVENTAYIFFDTNPAIVTNTTWNTIYECGDEANFDISDEVLCAEENLTGVATHDFVYTYNWSIDGEEFSDEADWSMIMDEPGVYAINLIGMNPLCTSENEVSVTVNPLPEAVITENGAILVASEGSAWQWFLDGTPLEGETGQSIEIMDSGVYTVEVFNDSGCSTLSLGVTVTSVDDITNQVAVLFPNPMTERATLMLSEGAHEIQILNTQGQIVRLVSNPNSKTVEIDRGDLASGTYYIKITTTNQSGVTTIPLVVQ
ncbi:MAG: T9SS type A sorting domain-containing protein, partial [Flavobacteriales bacterium]|nr:T9SS type A sorting domain-containing protein [Flavobacteriales bacterium]